MGKINNTNYKSIIILLILPVILFLISLSLGRYPISISELMTVFYSAFFTLEHNLPDTMNTVIFEIRLPRILGAMMVGAALSVAGTAYQGIFRNPLVSPDILGASTGAGFGAALGILLSLGMLGIQLMSFIFGLVAVLLVYGISLLIRKSDPMLTLILAGILIGAMFSSFISLTKYVADPYDQLPEITFWLMGSLAAVRMVDIYSIIIPFIIGFVPLFLLRWRLNVMSFGEEEAQALGVNPKNLKIIIIICATFLTASVVSISGIIGWVGLVIPHFTRSLVGPDNSLVIPISILVGSSFLLLVDTFARTAMQMEVPLGILTSLIGIPFFLYLLIHSRRGWV